MHFKTLIKRFFLIGMLLVTIVSSGLVFYDPLHIFHKSWITQEDRIHGNMRLQAAGIINNYDFDSVIVGTSMMKGTSAAMASGKIGGTFVNLSSDGSSIVERRYIIEYALRKKSLQNVVISFDTGLDANLKKEHHRFPISKFDYLYDKNPFNDAKAYWNYKFLGCMVTFSKADNCVGEKRGMQRNTEWFKQIQLINAKISGIENWVHAEGGRGKAVHSRVQRHIKKPIGTEEEYSKKLKLTKEIVDDSLFSIIGANEAVEFHVVFPPYSRFLYSLWKQKNPYKYKLYIETLRYLVVEGARYKNLKVYSFDDSPYLNNLSNYRDMRHYNTDMNESMLDSIKERRNIMTVNNLEAFIVVIDKLNSNYDLDEELGYLLNSY